MKPSLILNNMRGFSLVESLLAAAVVSIMTLSIASFGAFMSSFNRAEAEKTVVYDFKEELITSLSSPGYWENIVAGANSELHPTLNLPLNPELACVKNQTLCTEGTYNLTIVDRKNVIRFDALDSAAGFDRKGNLCKQFSSTQEDPQLRCPFRYDVTWTAVCDFGVTQCTNPLIRISAQLVLNRSMDITANLTVANLSFYVAADVIPDPVPKSYLRLTNSTVLNFGASTLLVDMTQAVTYTGSMSTLVFTSASGLSDRGGTVSIAGSTMTYNPPAGYYGRDSVSYQVTGPSGTPVNGTIDIGVMTPHTWLGPTASGGPIGRTTTSSNFCGQVINSVCDRASFPAWPDIHYVLNDLCISCDMEMDNVSAIATFEMSSSYIGTVTKKTEFPIGGVRGDVWKKLPVFSQANGTFRSDPNVSMYVSNRLGLNAFHAVNEKAFVLTGGAFIAPLSAFGLRVLGSVDIATGTYQHNNGKFEILSIDEAFGPIGSTGLVGTINRPDLTVFNAPNVEFYDFNFGASGGDKIGVNIQSSFRVKNNLGIYPNRDGANPSIDQDTMCTWENGAQVAGTYSETIVISVEKNINVAGFGGRGSLIGCKAPAIKFVGAGLHTITGVAAPTPWNTRNFMGTGGMMWNNMRSWINSSVPHIPFLLIDDPGVSVKFNGVIGFRRGLVNKSDSTLDFSTASLVFANSDPGDVTFTPETNPAVSKNRINDIYFASTGGGRMVIGSRRLHVTGKIFSFFANETALTGDGVGGATTEIHTENDFSIGQGENYKLQENIAFPVKVVFCGTSDQWLNGGNSGWMGNDGQTQFTLEIKKDGGRQYFVGNLTLHRDLLITKLGGSYMPLNMFSVHVPDKGNNTYAQTIRVDAPGFIFDSLFLDHNVKLPTSISVGIDTGVAMQIGSRNRSSTKTIEPGPGVVIRTWGLHLVSNLQTGNFDKPIQVVGGNPLRFKLEAISGIYAWRTLLSSTQPQSVTMDIPNLHFEASVPAAGPSSVLTYTAKLRVASFTVVPKVKACMYTTYNFGEASVLNMTNLTVNANSALLWQNNSATATTSSITAPGVFAQTSGSYPCP